MFPVRYRKNEVENFADYYLGLSHVCRLLWLSPHTLYRRWSRKSCLSYFLLLWLVAALVSLVVWPKGDLAEVKVVLSSGFPLHVISGYTLQGVLQNDVTGKLPEDLQQDIAARVGQSRLQSVRLLSVPVRQPRCAALIKGDQQEQRYAMKYMEWVHTPPEPSLSAMSDAPRDCEAFVKSRGYIMHATQQEREFPIAYGMLLYRDVDQAERLLRAIYRPHNLYCLHVDAKSSRQVQDAVRGLAKCLPNVNLASRQNTVDWGGYSSLTPHFYCMRDVWHRKWKYYINLTGQEFPLKTNLQIVNILKALNGSNVVDSTDYKKYHNRWYNNFPPPDNIKPRKGHVFILASRGMVDFILHSPVAQRFQDWVSRTQLPDETYFPSLNHNPHLNVPGSYLGSAEETHAEKRPYIARFVNWGTNWKDSLGRLPFSWPCGGKRVRDICIFGVADLPLLTSRRELFANKFDAGFEPVALHCLEEWHFNMTLVEYSGMLSLNTSWYAGLDIVKNAVGNVLVDSGQNDTIRNLQNSNGVNSQPMSNLQYKNFSKNRRKSLLKIKQRDRLKTLAASDKI